MRESNIFFLEELDCYVSLVRGERAMPAFANKTVRVADWYIRKMDEGRAEARMKPIAY